MPTAFKQVKNNVGGTLNAAVIAGDTSWVLGAGQGASFPATPFYVSCENEVATCTARTTDTLTVTRGQDGTSAAAHSGGVLVEVRDVAALFTDLATAVNSLENGTGGGYLPLTGGTLTGNLLFSTDNTRDIGASGATRPRSIYAATDVVTPQLTGPAAADLIISPLSNFVNIRNGTNPQTLRIYNTYTNASTNEAGFFYWNGNILNVGTWGIGGGVTGRWIAFSQEGALRWIVKPSGLVAGADNAYDIGEVGGRPRDLLLGRNAKLDGFLGVGSGSSVGGDQSLSIVSTTTAGTSQWGIRLVHTASSATTGTERALSVQAASAAAAFTMTEMYGIDVLTPSKGAGSGISLAMGMRVRPQNVATVDNYGIYIEAPSGGSGVNFGLYNAGTTVMGNIASIGSGTIDNSVALGIFPNNILTGAFQYGMRVFPKYSIAATSYVAGMEFGIEMVAGSAATGTAVGFSIAVPVLGASRTITDIVGVYINNQGGAGRTNAYGIRVLAQTGASGNNISLDVLGRAKFAEGGVVAYLGQYAGLNAFSTTSVGAWVQVTGATVVATTRGLTGDMVLIDITIPVTHTVANGRCHIAYMLDGSPVYYSPSNCGAANTETTMRIACAHAVPPGSHTFGIGIYLLSAGTLTVNNGGYTLLRVVEARAG